MVITVNSTNSIMYYLLYICMYICIVYLCMHGADAHLSTHCHCSIILWYYVIDLTCTVSIIVYNNCLITSLILSVLSAADGPSSKSVSSLGDTSCSILHLFHLHVPHICCGEHNRQL